MIDDKPLTALYNKWRMDNIKESHFEAFRAGMKAAVKDDATTKHIRESLYDILHNAPLDQIAPNVRHRLAVLLDIATRATEEQDASKSRR